MQYPKSRPKYTIKTTPKDLKIVSNSAYTISEAPQFSDFLGKNESQSTLSRRGGSTITPRSHHHNADNESQYGTQQKARLFIFHEEP